MVKRWWVFPLLLGLPAGVLLGAWRCWMSPLFQLYANCHFYRLVTKMLAEQVAVAAGLIVSLLLVMRIGLAITRRCPPAIAMPLRVGIALATLLGAGKLFLPLPIWAALWQPFTDPDVLRFCCLGIALIVLGGVFWRLRGRKPVVTWPRFSPHPRCAAATCKMLLGLSLCGCLLFVSVLLAAVGWWTASAHAARKSPNVILIMVCSLRADHLGCYGYDLPTTPNLDRFAQSSTRFAHAVAPSSWTLWSTASVLTSRYPERIFRRADYVADNTYYPGLPSTLANLGYATHCVSDHPFLANDLNFTYSQGFDSLQELSGEGEFTQKLAPTVTAQALKRTARTRQPLFLYLMYADPHEPYEPYTQQPEFVFGPAQCDVLNPRWISTLAPELRQMKTARMQRLLVSDVGDENGIGDSRQRRLAKYNSQIARTDRAIGDFLEGLKRQDKYDNSLIIICGDHGEEFLEHGRYGHQYTLYPEVVNVPLLVKAPGQRVGKVIDGRFPLIDLFPSILAMLHRDGSRLNLQGDGSDLSVLLRCADKPVYGATVNRLRSVSTRNYVYVRGVRAYNTGGPPFEPSLSFHLDEPITRLFDVHADPGQYHDVRSVLPDMAVTLNAMMRRHDAELDAKSVLTSSASASRDDAQRAHDKLRSLGYMQ